MKAPIAFEVLANLLEAERPCQVPIWGISMHPFLQVGDSIQLGLVLPEALRLGDLIAFRREDRLIVHRFAGHVRLDQVTWLRQKGDNLRGFGLVRLEDLMGRVTYVTRAGGSRPMLSGFGLWRNRILGCQAWMICRMLELRQHLGRRLRRAVAP